ncbi:MAG: hypothetical protein H0T92_14960 [Pyrinomonadaceae bacterium]|nr:hypothetical protein [Pyrinomonadaceae bacterium]
MTNQPADLITVAAAKELLKVSHNKISRLIKAGTLRHFTDALDMRVKLVSRGEALALKSRRVTAGESSDEESALGGVSHLGLTFRRNEDR